MPEKPDALRTVGLEIDGLSLRMAELSLRRGKPSLDKIREFPIEIAKVEEEGHVKQLYTDPTKELSSAAKSLAKELAITGLPAGEALIRPLEVKLKKDSDIDSILAFQSEPLLPYPVEQAILDRVRVGETPEGTLLTLLSVRKDHLAQHIEQYQSLGIEPEVVSAVPAALAAFAAQFAPSEAPRFLLHIGASFSACALVRENKLLAAQYCQLGVGLLQQAFQADAEEGGGKLLMENLDFSTIHAENHPRLAQALEQLRMEVTRVLYSLSKQAKGREIPDILVTGEGALCKNLPEELCKTIAKPIVLPTPDPLFDAGLPDLQKYAIPIGLALTGLPGYSSQVNFRQFEFAYPKPWKRFLQPLLLFFLLSVLLGGALVLYTNAWAQYRVNDLRKQYVELLGAMNRTYSEVEKEAVKNSLTKASQPLSDLGETEIAERLRMLEKDLQSSPETYPLVPNVPRVSDFLAWLANHPKMVKIDPLTGKRSPLLHIESFSYSLVKRPDQTKKNEKYQVKIELELSSSTPKFAREFHDALISPNQMIDPKGEVKWTTTRSGYRTVFFLKDKTAYP